MADRAGRCLRAAWEQQLLSARLQGVDSCGLRELGERSRESDAAEIRPPRPSLIMEGPPAEESAAAAAASQRKRLSLQASLGLYVERRP